MIIFYVNLSTKCKCVQFDIALEILHYQFDCALNLLPNNQFKKTGTEFIKSTIPINYLILLSFGDSKSLTTTTKNYSSLFWALYKIVFSTTNCNILSFISLLKCL